VPVPLSIHQFWDGPPLPEAFAAFAEGWQRLHPDWRYRLWGGGDLPPLRNQDLYDRAAEICPGLEGQLRSDIVRYELLHRFGGVWVDLDFECLKPIDDLLADTTCFVAWVTGEYVNNAIMGASRQHRFIKRLIDGLPASIAAHPGAAPRVVSGPHYLTPLWREHGKEDGVTAFPKRYFYEVLWSELKRLGEAPHKDEYARHYWNNRHRERGITVPSGVSGANPPALRQCTPHSGTGS